MEEKTNLDRKQLKYTIHCCSSFSGSYQPENILHDKPSDQSSRYLGMFLELLQFSFNSFAAGLLTPTPHLNS